MGLTFGAAVCVVGLGAGPAWTAPVGRQFVPTGSPVAWPATSAEGNRQSSTITIDAAEVAKGSQLPDADQLSPGQTYFYVALHPSYVFAGVPTPLAMPATAATLATPAGAVSGIQPPASNAVDASWYFPVGATLTSATLQISSFTKTLGNERGDFVPWTFSPQPIAFVAEASSAAPSTAPAGTTPSGSSRLPDTARTATGASTPQGGGDPGGSSTGVVVGAGLGGLVLLGAGAGALVAVRRRRAFARADREGRVVLTGPPLLTGLALPADRQAIVVKILGWLEIQGTKRPVRAGPLLELIVYLVLNPGRTFTSVQLRESIWRLGRQPITSATFRKYMVELRKAFGTGVVVTDRHRYELTASVLCDWHQFKTALRHDDDLVGAEEALALVRGPVLYGCFDGKKNAPFSWAVGTANDIEDEVTTTATDLAVACLALDDPERAAKAVSQGLCCAESNLALRKVDLRVAVALGGRRELDRRLEAARAALAIFPADVQDLEAEARTLGWAAVPPG